MALFNVCMATKEKVFDFVLKGLGLKGQAAIRLDIGRETPTEYKPMFDHNVPVETEQEPADIGYVRMPSFPKRKK